MAMVEMTFKVTDNSVVR